MYISKRIRLQSVHLHWFALVWLLYRMAPPVAVSMCVWNAFLPLSHVLAA